MLAVAEHLIALLAPPRCLACGAAVGAGVQLCGGCRRELPWLPRAVGADGVFAPVAYDGPARALVHALKFHGRTAAAALMATQIAANAPPGLFDGATLVPVPAHPRRRRERGFDQARLIAHQLARRLNRPSVAALERDAAGERQVGESRARRLTAQLGIEARARVKGSVVIVDDVVTTGATLAACERALRTAGAEPVAAVAYARTLR